ncbi:5-formyltetrahydrofolate cyclo-ligase [Alteromonas confluentis]|uniref:5-formyltetrahydrofolate cyclo-ligase n=1 Tax=Alteromonas confluentis TaxID=1656094 RepID=A0A1E7ZCY0_9ALTE|nr:5-formyltetrahydrofolate cyclo-ligase [Alteromonas confluentis]OFC71369.1 5-formyltetrahydrofolate cyclo-ligase [Alteromonas confluentis]
MASLPSEGLSRGDLRKRLRTQRNSLTPEAQHDAAHMLAEQLTKLPEWQRANTVAAYLENDGEVGLQAVINSANQADKILSLPVIHPFNRQHLLFLRYHQNTVLTRNRFNIQEPVLRCPDVVPFSHHQLILMPLVGFDADGNRLGMGGGFYDRVLAPYRHRENRPLLIGTAHDCQHVDHLPIEPWDFPLDMVITPSHVFRPAR